MTQTSCIIGTGRKMGAATGLAHNVQGQQHSLLPANNACSRCRAFSVYHRKSDGRLWTNTKNTHGIWVTFPISSFNIYNRNSSCKIGRSVYRACNHFLSVSHHIRKFMENWSVISFIKRARLSPPQTNTKTGNDRQKKYNIRSWQCHWKGRIVKWMTSKPLPLSYVTHTHVFQLKIFSASSEENVADEMTGL